MEKFRRPLPLLIGAIFLLEVIIYIWAVWTTVDAEYIFAKCARNSGRASAGLNLMLLVGVGYFGLKHIYGEKLKRDTFLILISLFAVNHLIHFFYIFQNFKSQSKVLEIEHNEHGIITFILILLLPLVLWSFRNLNKVLYLLILLCIFNTTYFMIDTFAGRVKPEDPAYLHQIGIGIMISCLLYNLYRVFRERTIDFDSLD